MSCWDKVLHENILIVNDLALPGFQPILYRGSLVSPQTLLRTLSATTYLLLGDRTFMY